MTTCSTMDLRPHIDRFARRLAEVEAALSDPKVFDNNQRAQELSREYSQPKELVASGHVYLKATAELDENRSLLQTELAANRAGGFRTRRDGPRRHRAPGTEGQTPEPGSAEGYRAAGADRFAQYD